MNFDIEKYHNHVETISDNQLINCKVFSNRESALKYLIPQSIDYLEIGVLGGDYSQLVLDSKNVKSATLLDNYNMYDWEGAKVRRFDETEHLNFVKKRFEKYNNVFLEIGNSQHILPLEGKKFDYIYIDADHRFKYVLSDLLKSTEMSKSDTIIGLNDFIMYASFWEPDSNNRGGFAVAAAVTQFLKYNQSWEVVGYAIENNGYSDIYIKPRNVI
jgi:hypothetical protein